MLQHNVANWYTYGSMNRITLSQDIMCGNSIQITNASTGIPVSAQKVAISYDSMERYQ